ncbi:MAG: alpha/beta fold hydrolase, partial [Gammaproteobacteria bacterium]
MKKALSLSCLLIALCLPNAQASDLEKEKRWAAQIVDSLMDGDATYLNDGTSDFLALVTESDETKKGAVVMHGSGVHPNWPTIVLPLRVGLTQHGWHTISIQMPVLANEAEYDEYTAVFPEVPARVDAAIEYLKNEMGVETVVLVAHSLGAAMNTYYLSNHKPDIAGFVAIGLGPGSKDPVRDTTEQLKKINMPMLDLYGEEDLPGVVENADARRQAQSGNAEYTQIMEPGADHFFE